MMIVFSHSIQIYKMNQKNIFFISLSHLIIHFTDDEFNVIILNIFINSCTFYMYRHVFKWIHNILLFIIIKSRNNYLTVATNLLFLLLFFYIEKSTFVLPMNLSRSLLFYSAVILLCFQAAAIRSLIFIHVHCFLFFFIAFDFTKNHFNFFNSLLTIVLCIRIYFLRDFFFLLTYLNVYLHWLWKLFRVEYFNEHVCELMKIEKSTSQQKKKWWLKHRRH